MTPVTEKVGTLCLMLIAMTVVGFAFDHVRDGPRVSSGGTEPPREPEFVENWTEAISYATRVAGQEGAAVKIIALVDLQCAVSRRFHELVMDLVSERPHAVQLLYIHYPLSYHEFALPAARGAECALEHGPNGFRSWIEALYANQDSLGQRAWTSLAAEAGFPNPILIEECIGDSLRDERINAGLRFGEAISLEWTPTIIVNGWRYFHFPSKDELRMLSDSVLMQQSTE